MLSKVWTPNGVGIALVSLSLVGLFFLESVFTPRSHRFEIPQGENAPLKNIPLDTSFKVVVPGGLSNLKMGSTSSFKDIFTTKENSPELLLVNFWATWCDPCVEEIPSLNWMGQQLSKNAISSRYQLVTISVDENSKSISKLERTLKTRFNFAVLHDPDGQFSRTLGITKFPETFLVDSNGTVLYKWIGPQDWQSQEMIQTLASLSKP